MAPGRTVPWCCWEEWYLVRDWLLSHSAEDLRNGIKRVEAWRARGRVPLGVDITASLLETALCDASFWGPAAATVASSSAAVAATGISQQQIRLQYSSTIVRMVNGIADSQQKGRVALSVNSLAEAAGLSRLLVDIRHEATHNELPSLSTLQLAAKQALEWLVSQYWQRQADHLQACYTRVQGMVTAVFNSCKAAAAKSAAAATADNDAAAAGDDDDALDAQHDDAQGVNVYKAAEGRKLRKQMLAELKGLVPPSHTSLLATLLLQSGVLQRGEQKQQQQQQQQQQGHIRGNAVHITALTALSKQYPNLKACLLETAVSRLAVLTAQQPQEERVLDQQQQLCICNPDTLIAWLQLLLPAANAAAGAPGANGIAAGSGGGSSSKQQGGSRSRQSCVVDVTAGGSLYSAATLGRLLATVVKARQQAAAAADHAAAGELVQQLHKVQQLLSSALVAASKLPATAGSSCTRHATALLQQLGDLAAPHGTSCSQASCGDGIAAVGRAAVGAAAQWASEASQVQQQQQEQQQGNDWQAHQQELLQHAFQEQQQLIAQQKQQKRKRQRQERDSTVVAAAAGAARQRKRWQRVANWSPCAIGCLPDVGRPQDLLALLHSSAPAAAAAAAAAGCATEAPAATAEAAAEQRTVPDGEGVQTYGGVAVTVLQQAGAALSEHEPVAAADAAATAAALCSQYEQQKEAAGVAAASADDADGDEDATAVRFGQHWQLSLQDLGQLQQAVRVLL